MTLVDTSVWIDHLRESNIRLAALLSDGAVSTHPFVIGELACGTFRRRIEVLRLMGQLPSVPAVDADEAMLFIEHHSLMGTGLGWTDVNLLASARLAGVKVWTRDVALERAARRLGVSA